jgi:hypothetical protein
MACCGGKRAQAAGASHGPQARPPLRSQAPRYSTSFFQYIGKTALTVVGPVSGNRYRFDGPGATVAVDQRDRPSLLAVPGLRQVLGP